MRCSAYESKQFSGAYSSHKLMALFPVSFIWKKKKKEPKIKSLDWTISKRARSSDSVLPFVSLFKSQKHLHVRPDTDIMRQVTQMRMNKFLF